MAVDWTNPYGGRGGLWLKGNLHGHTTRSWDGDVSPEEAIRIYERMGYAFAAFTEHNRVHDGSPYRSSLILLSGVEADFATTHHTCIVHPEGGAIAYDPGLSQQQLIDRNQSNGSLIVLNHPDYLAVPHYSLEELLQLRGYSGIEIYNSKIEVLEGSPLSTAKWDRLLSAGKRVIGFANQDFHAAGEMVDCCNVVKAAAREKGAIFDALKRGSLYCCYGVEITDIGRDGRRVHVETRDARSVRFIGREGRLLKEQAGPDGEFSFSDDADHLYVRIECRGEGKAVSWSQPFFREPEGGPLGFA